VAKEEKKNIENKRKIETSFAQKEKNCYYCGKKRHISPDCLEKNQIPKEK